MNESPGHGDRFGAETIHFFRQRALDEILKLWTQQLKMHLKDAQRRKSPVTVASYYPEVLSTWDLIRRGLDPSKHHTFRGRVSLQIRCRKRGHILAQVYPTCTLPVLVPTIAMLPAGPNGKKEVRARVRHSPESQKRRQMAPWDLWSARDPWIEAYADEDQLRIISEHLESGKLTSAQAFNERRLYGHSYDIRGLTVLHDGHRTVERYNEFLDCMIQPVWEFLCRCGTTQVPTATVMDTLDQGIATLTM